MFCLKCGKEMENGAKFCPHCGAATAAASGPAGDSGAPSAPAAPVYTMPDSAAQWPSPPEGGNKRRNTGLIIGGAVAAVLVIVAIIAAIGGLFASPKGQVEKAFAKTAAAYAEAKSGLGAADLNKLIEERSYTQRMSLELNSINEQLIGWNGLSSLKGIGLRMDADYNQKDRKMDLDMAAYWDGEDLASIQMLVDDSSMTFSSPQFTRGDAYGFNTETLGADLEQLGAWDKRVDLKKIGFNLFDLMETAFSSREQAKETRADLADACKELFDAVEVKKSGKQSVQVNGKSTDAVLYHVVVPEDAMKDYIDAMADAIKALNSNDVTRDMLQSMGFDKDTIDEMLSDMNAADVYGEMAATLRNMATTIGDLELDVYISGGYVCAVEYSGRVQGSKLEMGLYLGGGDNYVDDLSLEIAEDSQKITIKSSGDHAGKSGVFTDETVIRVGSTRVTSELRYEPKAAKDNFEWTLKAGSLATVSMEGQLTTTKDSVDLKLEDLSVKAAGAKLISLSAGYYLGPCEGMRVSHPSPKLIGDMDKEDLVDMYVDIGANLEEWADDMADRLPSDLLYALW